MIRILMVCTGNICRSPTAEAVLRRHLDEAGLGDKAEVDSAGTGSWHVGDPPSPLARELGRSRGYDLDSLRARQIHDRDFIEFDLILGLDRGHLSALKRLEPARGRARIALLMDYAEDAPSEVPDPYYGGRADYAHSLDLIERAMPGLMAAVTELVS